jgi:hypothetical protein
LSAAETASFFSHTVDTFLPENIPDRPASTGGIVGIAPHRPVSLRDEVSEIQFR